MNLHLGSGGKNHPDYINIDIIYQPGVDSIDNVRFLRRYKENSIDKIYACHVLEHFPRWDYMSVLKRWHSLLKPGGRLRIAVPNFEAIVKCYNEGKSLDNFIGLLYGGQDYSNNNHFIIWDFNLLEKNLKELGFKNINKYDWNQDDFSSIDDFSKSYIPHMDFDNGVLMSLNVECFK